MSRTFKTSLQSLTFKRQHRDWKAFHRAGVASIGEYLEFKTRFGNEGVIAVLRHGVDAAELIKTLESQHRFGRLTAKVINEHGKRAIRILERYPEALNAINRHGRAAFDAIKTAEERRLEIRPVLKALSRR